jgi:hypothetical protein
MIEKFNLCGRYKSIDLLNLLSHFEENTNYDFYYTKDNSRYYITDLISLKNFLKTISTAYIAKEKDDYLGIITVWKGVSDDKVRYYIKLSAKTTKIASDLITVLLWNFNKELYVKIRKDSKFIEAFKQKNFRFIGARGSQILLNRKFIPNKINTRKEEHKDV